MPTETATLAGGCFWCLEAVFERIRGVERVTSGYTGGTLADPGYHAVCTGQTGHAEAIRIEFDPGLISYRELLDFFFAFHDPTTLNRQGPDTGTQYRSAIFYHTPGQKAAAEAAIADLTAGRVFDDPIVTAVVPAPVFFPAETSHQGYFRQNAGQPYCQAVIGPKVARLRARYAERLK